MNGEDLYLTQKKFIVEKLRLWLRVKITKHKTKKLQRKEKIVDVFNRKDALTVANFFSYLRIIFALLIIIALESYNNIFIIILFSLGLITDWLDGIFAEVYDEITEIGKIIDPTADKFLIIGAIWPYKKIIIMPLENTTLQPIIFLILLETALMLTAFIKPWINKKYEKKFRTGANIWGKGKMIIESIMVYVILLFDFTNNSSKTIILIILSLSLLFALMSFINHWRLPKSPD